MMNSPTPHLATPSTLAHCPVGQHFVLQGVKDPEAALLLLRLGLGEGDEGLLLERLPMGGPYLLRFAQQELALGAAMATQLAVQVLPT